MTTPPEHRSVEEQVARHLATKDWPPTGPEGGWDAATDAFRTAYLADAREVIAIVAAGPQAAPPADRAERDELRRKLASCERIRENADFHLGQEMARRQMADKETARLWAVVARLGQMADAWEQRLPETIVTATAVDAIRQALEPAAVPVVPPADRAANDLVATTCSAQYQGDEAGARLCIRAAQHTGKAHTDEHGFHWSDTVAVYPVADGTFRVGTDVPDVLRRVADEAQQSAPRQWCKCASCWGWFVEDHPGEDLDELGRNLGWWSGLPVHRDAPAEAQPTTKPDEVVHACPPYGSGITPCCERTPFELPRTDRMSTDPALVTCTHPAVVSEPGKEA